MSASRLGFTCRACGRLWARTYAGEGEFRWETSAHRDPHKLHEAGWFLPGGQPQGGSE